MRSYGYDDYYDEVADDKYHRSRDEEEGEDEREEDYEDERVVQAREAVLSTVAGVKVVTDREIKVRLEKRFFPWVTGRAMGQLLRSGELVKNGYAGRRKMGGGVTDSFFSLAGTRYDDIRAIIQEKREVSAGIAAVLTGDAPAGTHAEDLFQEGFDRLGFTTHGRDSSEFRGKRITGESGKEPPNVDFVIERDGVVYGVDVKNWIQFEAYTRAEVVRKVKFALQLGTQPWIMARYVDEDTIYTEIIEKKGIAYRYSRLLLPSVFQSLAQRAEELLGYSVLATDVLPDYMLNWVLKLHTDNLSRLGGRRN